MPDHPSITVERYARTTNYTDAALTTLLAVVRYQGDWIVNRFMGDDVTSERVATRDYAEALAMRHARTVAA